MTALPPQNLFNKDTADFIYNVIRENHETTGKGIPAPQLSQKLFDTQKYRDVIALMVESCLSDKVELKQGPGGGFVLKDVPRSSKGKNGKIALNDETKAKIEETINLQLKHLNNGRGTTPDNVFLALVQTDPHPSLEEVKAAIVLLVSEGKFVRRPGVGIIYPFNKENLDLDVEENHENAA